MAGEEYWSVVYRAVADFAPLIRAAAEAKAALDALGKSSGQVTNDQIAGESRLVDLRKQEVQGLKDEGAAARQTADSYKQYNQQALFGGRSDMQSHLGDMERELQYETLLNRQRWLGFTTPQQAYAWRQNEYNQRLLMNRAEWGGYATADQYIAYLQKQTTAWQQQNAAMLQRVGLYKQNADAAVAYYNALQGTHKTIGEIGGNDNLSGVTSLNNALSGLPDQVSTQVNADTSTAMAQIAAYVAALSAIPGQVNTTATLGSGGGFGAPPETQTITPVVNDEAASSEMERLHRELNQMPDRVTITADFEDAAALAKAQAFYAFLEKHRSFGATETLTTVAGAGGASGGGGGGSPPVAAAGADGEPNPNDIAAVAAAEKNLAAAMTEEKNNAAAAAAAENNLAKALITEHLAAQQASRDTTAAAMSTAEAAARASAAISALNQLAASAEKSGDASKYAYAAQVLQAAATKATGTAAMVTVAQLAEQAAAAHSAGDASNFAYAAQNMLKGVLQDMQNPAAAAAAALEQAGAAAEDTGHSAQRAYGYWGLLNKQVTLWAGLLGDTHMIGQVQLWHILMDGLIEVFALWIPALAAAAIGLTAWGLAGFQAAEKIGKQMFNVWQVSTALNESVPPLTKGMNELAKAAQPQVYQLFGDALTILNNKGGAFSTIVSETGQYLDKLGARITVLLTSGGNGLINFFQTGAKDLAIIGQGFDSLITILAALIKATAITHIAEDLAMVGDAILKVVALIAKIPPPVLAAVLALHGIILWGGLAVDVLAKVAIGFAGVTAKIGALNEVSLTVASALGASTDKLTKMAQSAPAVQAMSTALGTSSKEAAEFEVNASKLGMSIDELALGTQAGRDLFVKYGASLEDAGQDAVKLTIATQGTETAVASVASGFSLAGKGAKDAETGLADTEKATTSLGGKMGNLATSLPLVGGLLSKLADVPILGWAAALAVALAAAYTWLALLPDPTQKFINSLNQAVEKSNIYQVIGTNVQTLASATEALSEAQAKGVGNVTELTGAQQQLSTELSNELDHIGSVQKAYGISMPQALDLMNTAGVKTNQLFSSQASVWAVANQQIKGLVLGYEAMGQQLGAVGGDLNVLLVNESSQVKTMGNLNTAWDTWTKTVSGGETSFISFAQGMATFVKDSGAAGASMNGLGAAALTLQNDFESSYGDVEKLFDAFRSQQALTGQGNFTAFVKDAVASLIPMAGKSKEAAAQVSALAQEAGGPATTNLSSLAKWAGNVKDPMDAMYGAINQSTIASSKLSDEAKRLSDSLQSILNPALAQAQFAAVGGQKGLNDFADALIKTGVNSQQTQTTGKAVATELLAVEKNAGQAKDTFTGWAESMGLSASQANKLWGEVSKGSGTADQQAAAVKKLRDQLASAHDATTALAKPGEWDTILKSFKDGTFYELTFLSWIPGVQRGLNIMNHDIGQFFGHDIPEAVGITAHAFEAAWDGMVNWFTQSVPHGLEVAWGAVSSFFDKAFTHDIPAIWDKAWSDTLGPVVRAFDQLQNFIASSFDKWWATHGQSVIIVWNHVWDAIKDTAVGAFNTIVSIGEGFWHTLTAIFTSGPAKDIWNFLVDEAKAAWALVTDTAKASWTEIEGLAKAAWAIVSALAKAAWDIIFDVTGGVIKAIWALLEGTAKVAWDLVAAIAKIVWDTIVAVVSVALDIITGHWSTAWKDMQNYADQVWNAIKALAIQIWNAISTAGTQMWNALWGAVKTAATQVWNAIKTGAQQAWNAIWTSMKSSFINPVGNFFTKTVPGYWSSFANTAKSTFGTVWKDFSGNVLTPVGNWFSKTLPSALEGAFKNSINWVITNVINKVIGDINAVTKVVGIPAIPGVPGVASGGTPASAARRLNGSVPGPSDSDNMLAMVMGGEYVIRQPARMALEAKHGRGFMDYLNHFDTLSGSGSRGVMASQRGGVPSRRAEGGLMVSGYASGGGILGSIEGFLSDVGGGISSAASGLGGLVKGGASALAGLIAKGARAVFDGVWDGSIGTLLNLVPEGTLPGDVTHFIGAEIKNGIDTVLGAKDAAAAKTAAAEAKSSAGITGAGVSNTSAEAALQSAAAKKGWTGAEWTALYDVEMREAGFSLTATNPSSGAYGMAQFIDGASEYATYGGNSTTAAGQAVAMVNYIAQRYGDPEAAWAHEQAYNWYASGGPVVSPIAATPTGATAAQSGAWVSAASSMLKDWNTYQSAFSTLVHEPSSGITPAVWTAWTADKSMMGKTNNFLASYMAKFSNPSSVNGHDFANMTGPAGTPLMGLLLQGHVPDKSYWTSNVTPSAEAATHRFPGPLATSFSKFRDFSVQLRLAQLAEAAWQNANSAGAGGGSTGGGGTVAPGPIAMPTSGTTASLVNLMGYATMGGPSSGVSPAGAGMQGFASGGPVGLAGVSSMFAVGLPLANGVTVPVSMPAHQMGQLGRTHELPRTMSSAAASSGNRVGLQVDQLNITNPVPEPPSMSITRAANRLAFLAGRGDS